MTLIIKEMAIKVSLQESGGGKGEKGKEPEKTGGGGQVGSSGDMVAIVAERVLEVLRENIGEK